MRVSSTERLLLQVLRCPAGMVDLTRPEWSAVVAAARTTRVLGRIGSDAFRADLLGKLPDSVAHHLRDAHADALFRHRTILWDLNRVVRVLQGIDTPIVLLKGAAYVAADLHVAEGRICSRCNICKRE